LIERNILKQVIYYVTSIDEQGIPLYMSNQRKVAFVVIYKVFIILFIQNKYYIIRILKSNCRCSSPRPVQGGRAINKGGLVLLSKRKLSDATFNAYHPEAKLFWTNGYIKADVIYKSRLYLFETCMKSVTNLFEIKF
jgi:hypothetical protein